MELRMSKPRVTQVQEFMLTKLGEAMPTFTVVTDPREPIVAGQIRWVADVKRFTLFAQMPSPLVLIAYNGASAKDGGENKSQGGVLRYIAGEFSLFLFAPNLGPAGDGEADILQMLDDSFLALESEVAWYDGKPSSRLYWKGERRYDIFQTSVCFEQLYDNVIVRSKVLSD
jgi:hypothetical protein